jgi:hypothetical protein
VPLPVDEADADTFTVAILTGKVATMVAGILYVIGLISVLLTIVAAGFAIPTTITEVTRQIDTGGTGAQNLMSIAQMVAATYAQFATPFLAGLLLMGAGRALWLLGAINRSLRGQG